MNLLRRSGPADAQAGQSPALPASTARENEAEALIAELREAARAAGMQRDDPMMPLLTAFARSIRFLAARTAGSDRVAAEASQRITDAIQQGRDFADAELARFRSGLAETEADTIQRVARAIASSADDALRRRIDTFDRNTALLAAAVLVASILAAAAGGYWWGNRSAHADIHETEFGLQVAFSYGADAARTWLGLITWNDIHRSLSFCAKPGQSRLQDGRKACDVPLWVEPPHPAPPNAP